MTQQKPVAWVTGGTGGIGSSICRELADAGYQVVAGYNNPDKAKTWLETQKSDGYDNIDIAGIDLTDFEACQNGVKAIEDQHGPIAVLVNCAGITKDGTLKKMSADQWNVVIDTNLNSVFNTCRSVIESMLEQGYGRIINISSINGRKGQFGQVNYSAAKAGMHGLTMALAQETATKGITVNTISPGYIATDMIMKIPEKVREAIRETIPMKRYGTPEEIGRLVNFLASKDNGFITGANIDINGGQFMG
ncbi:MULTISPECIES: acetoacetyl-CoA reductase [Halomonas]|uniref:Acetoacetyl-CoA reductase n=3 Tax=Halomonas TaxID=2745 RepID=A0AAU7KIS7_9GAMM|nr:MULTISPECIES: acetoacetyl-CoA reductase [Halomonas]MBR9770352.1 acetoacetyl-CoA reductase [Gammaproteobacteria bacterium]KJZ17613.1 3-ketoacyl-ACP reductase [Halomonas sp. S2151]MAR72585.1 beta-ketoacyl-ACP reductase [Halomonas sp.]MBR9878075.1 acetoacetyl-CoA reductase [Gammaproteobacteria bacterium]MBS8270606.1 acetoacetyl-CoA reductase [Halomonas litopenaei]|tara:strand:- start:206 stop:952 length:747 start_codon:yes stop_codon:yes gene_type:complete